MLINEGPHVHVFEENTTILQDRRSVGQFTPCFKSYQNLKYLGITIRLITSDG